MSKIKKREWTTKSGKINYSWRVDYKDSSKRIRKSGFKTKPEAEIYLANELSNIGRGLSASSNKKITFDKASEDYIKYDVETYCKPSTIDTYKRYLKVHLNPFFSGMQLAKITPQKVQEFIKHQMENTSLSNNSINKNIVLLGSILKKQVDEGVLFSNPVYKVKKLKIEQKEMRALNKQEVQKLLITCKKHKPDFYPLLLTAVLTGMRRGEVLGLTWDKINWVNKEILVNKSIYKGQLLEPKTSTSIRKINMPDELIKTLREWQLKSMPNEKDFIFPTLNGSSKDPRNLIRREFNPILKRAGLGKLRWHDLRHSFASLLIAQNVQPKYIQSQMGHSSIRITMDRYGHLLPEVHEQGIKALDGLFVA